MADGGRLPLRSSKLRLRNGRVLCPDRPTHLYYLPWCLRTLYSFLANRWLKRRYRRWILVLLAVAVVHKVGIQARLRVL